MNLSCYWQVSGAPYVLELYKVALALLKSPETFVSLQVDFYIGTDATSMLLEPSSPPAHASSQSVNQEYSSAQLLAVSDEEEAYLSESGVPLMQDEVDMSRQSVLRNASPDKTPSPILPAALVEEAILSNRPVHLSYDSSDDRGTPSPGASASPSRRPSLRGKVTFVLGTNLLSIFIASSIY